MRRFLLVVAVAIATVFIVAYLILSPYPPEETWYASAWLAWAPVGGFILWRRPGNGVGLTMLAIGLANGVAFASDIFSRSGAPLQIRIWSDLVGVLLGVLSYLAIVWLMLVFPSGRLENRIERVAAGLLSVVTVVVVLSFSVATGSMEGPTGRPSPLATPWLEEAISWFVSSSGVWVLVTLVLLAVFALARRWYRSAGVERHQYRWLLLGALVFAGVLVIGQVMPEESNGTVFWLLAGLAMPVAVGISITRYRLYDIDRIISRTVTYGLVVGLLTGAVAGLATAIGTQFGRPWVVAATTLAVAAVFNPLRRRVQGLVDRRFNRSRYDAERVMNEFSVSLQDRIDSEALVDGWVGVVNETMQPASVGVWVRG